MSANNAAEGESKGDLAYDTKDASVDDDNVTDTVSQGCKSDEVL